jgi:tight adherence protein B
MYVIIWALGFVALLLAFEGFSSARASRRNQHAAVTRRRLREITRKLQDPKADEAGESMLRSVKPEKNTLESLLDAVPGHQEIQLRLYRAGLSIPAERFVYLSVALAVVGFALGFLFIGDPLKSLMFLALGLLPWVQISRMHEKRLLQFEKQFPDALDLLIRALRAGHSLTAGFVMVGNELSDPIGGEFGHVADEVQLGQSMRKALSNLAYRVDSPDLPFFVTAIAIQQETGSNLAEVLENLANVMRERFKLIGKVRAITAMGRASANLLAAWPLVTLASLYMVNPAYIAPLWETPEGHDLVMISAAMVAVGYVLCRKMATIRV